MRIQGGEEGLVGLLGRGLSEGIDGVIAMLTMDLCLTATENAMKDMSYGTGNYFRTARRT